MLRLRAALRDFSGRLKAFRELDAPEALDLLREHPTRPAAG